MSTMAPLPQLERYEVISEIGRGAMGVVYKARDTVLDRIVAIKAVDMSIEREYMAKYEARFYQEARAAGGLNHPGIVTIYDIGKSGTLAFMAMEYIEGEELRALLAAGRPLPMADAISISAQVAEALAFAHERGIVHRDIKPANIMIVQGRIAKITDFGIARTRAASELTQTGMMLGSPKYMSPEQALGKRADPKSDMFSLGVILYEMLTGHPPFVGETVAAVMYQIVNFLPPAPSAINPAVPPRLDIIVARMLAKPVEERFEGLSDVASALRECEKLPASLSDTDQTLVVASPSAVPPSLIESAAKSQMYAQTPDFTRASDTGESITTGTAPVTHDSNDATRALAQLSGISVDATQTNRSGAGQQSAIDDTYAAEMRPAWRRRDWLLVGGAALAGLAIGTLLPKDRRR